MFTTDDLMTMVEKVIDSPDLPKPYRVGARLLLSRVEAEPDRVQEHLRRMAAEFSSTAVYATPTADLFRCIPAETVHKHMTSRDWRMVDSRAFLRTAARHPDPAAFITSTIPAGQTIFLPYRSWLIDTPGIVRWPSREIIRRLELGADRLPPYVVFRLTPARMAETGVGIRLPNALDAAAGGQAQWSPGGLAEGTEYLDHTVTIEAVEDILWKP